MRIAPLSRNRLLGGADHRFPSGSARFCLKVAGITEVAKFISAGAVLDEINVSQNKLGVDGAKALASVIPESSLKSIVIGSKSTRVPVHNSEVTSLDVSGQKLGPIDRWQ